MRSLILVVPVLALTTGSLHSQGQAIIPVVSLKDQFDQPHDVKDHRGDVVVLIYGDKASATANKKLGELIHVTFHPTAKSKPPAEARKAPVMPIPGAMVRSPDVLAIPIACVGKVPGVVQAAIRWQIRRAAPDAPLWLDFADVLKSQVPFEAGVPNVVVLDVQGRYRYAAAGDPSPDGTRQLLGIIEGLRREAVASR